MFKRAPKLNAELLRLLKAFRADPALVVQLYESLFFGRFWALAQQPAEIWQIAFLTYPTASGIQELPVFTAPDRPTLARLAAESGATSVEVDGISLWPRLLEVVKTGEIEAAVDPGESYGIRLTLEMILTMVRVNGDNVQLPQNI
jgi:hypothetical protein